MVQLRQGTVEHIQVKIPYQSLFLHFRNKAAGRNQASLFVQATDQGLRAGNCAIGHVDLGLEIHCKPFRPDKVPGRMQRRALGTVLPVLERDPFAAHDGPGLIDQLLASKHTIGPGIAHSHRLGIPALQHGAQAIAPAKKYFVGGIGAEGYKLSVPGAKKMGAPEKVRQRPGNILQNLPAVRKAQAAIDGRQAGNIQAHRAHGAVCIRGKGAYGIGIGTQVGQAL